MSGALRVLVVEDFEDDALLVRLELQRGGFEPLTFQRVENGDDLSAALATSEWDVVITDYALPKFSGPEALDLVKRSGRDVPVIIISGTVNEELAVTCLKSGASDFMSKGRLTRLVPAVHRELREAASRRARASAIEALKTSEDRYRLLFESSPLPSFVFDAETRAFLEVNDVALRHYGYTRGEFLCLKLDDLWPDEERSQRAQMVDASGEEIVRASYRQKKRDGTTIEVELTSHAFAFAGRAARLSIVNDVTEKKRLEEQLRQATKMDAIGQLAGGVAHDFNNILAAITSYAELVREALVPSDPAREDVEEISRAAFRASDLTRQLLAFSRQQRLEPVVLHLDAIVSGVESMLRRTIREDIALATELGATGHVKADKSQLEQIVLNLTVNARDAMPDGGTLTIRTFDVTLDNEPIVTGVASGEHVALSVSDTGIGMSAATQARIFEPFFTTKPVGKGTGLGLATVYGIVTQSHAHLSVVSEVGRGSTFTVYLPRIDEAPPAPSPRGPSARRSQTDVLLLVEDDHMLRKITARVLRIDGYEVLEAESAEVARAISRTHQGPIAIILTDVVMPETSGPALVAELARDRPEMRVLLMSGYVPDRTGPRSVPAGTMLLEKPFTPDALKRKIREALDSNGK